MRSQEPRCITCACRCGYYHVSQPQSMLRICWRGCQRRPPSRTLPPPCSAPGMPQNLMGVSQSISSVIRRVHLISPVAQFRDSGLYSQRLEFCTFASTVKSSWLGGRGLLFRVFRCVARCKKFSLQTAPSFSAVSNLVISGCYKLSRFSQLQLSRWRI